MYNSYSRYIDNPISNQIIVDEAYKEVDFNDDLIRLIWAVHYITVSSQEYTGRIQARRRKGV